MTEENVRQLIALSHNQLRGHILATQHALREVMLDHPDPDALSQRVAQRLNKLHAYLSETDVPDALLQAIEAGKADILPSDDDLAQQKAGQRYR